MAGKAAPPHQPSRSIPGGDGPAAPEQSGEQSGAQLANKKGSARKDVQDCLRKLADQDPGLFVSRLRGMFLLHRGD